MILADEKIRRGRGQVQCSSDMDHGAHAHMRSPGRVKGIGKNGDLLPFGDAAALADAAVKAKPAIAARRVVIIVLCFILCGVLYVLCMCCVCVV